MVCISLRRFKFAILTASSSFHVLQLQGKEPGKCNSRVEAAALPKAFGLSKRVSTDKPGGSKNSL